MVRIDNNISSIYIFDTTVKYMIGNDKDILQVGIVDIGIGKNKYI